MPERAPATHETETSTAKQRESPEELAGHQPLHAAGSLAIGAGAVQRQPGFGFLGLQRAIGNAAVQRLVHAIQRVGGKNEFPDQTSLDGHFDKHVTKQGDAGSSYKDGAAYESAAKGIANGDYTHTKTKGANSYFFKQSTGQFVVVRGGFVRSLFVPSRGKAYYDDQ